MRFMDGSTLFLNWSFGNFFLPPSREGAKPNLMFRNFKVVVRTLVRIGCKRTEVRATLKKLPKA